MRSLRPQETPPEVALPFIKAVLEELLGKERKMGFKLLMSMLHERFPQLSDQVLNCREVRNLLIQIDKERSQAKDMRVLSDPNTGKVSTAVQQILVSMQTVPIGELDIDAAQTQVNLLTGVTVKASEAKALDTRQAETFAASAQEYMAMSQQKFLSAGAHGGTVAEAYKAKGILETKIEAAKLLKSKGEKHNAEIDELIAQHQAEAERLRREGNDAVEAARAESNTQLDGLVDLINSRRL